MPDRQRTKFTGPSGKVKNKVISFRIPEDILSDIDYSSYKKGLTVNAYVRDVLIKHTRWDIFAERFGLVPVPKSLLKTLSKEIRPEKIDELVAIVYDEFKEWVIFVKGMCGLKQSIESLEDFMRASGIESDHLVVGDIHTYNIKHDLGPGWSLFGQKFLIKIFDTFVPSKDIEFEVTSTTLISRISLGNRFSEHDY